MDKFNVTRPVESLQVRPKSSWMTRSPFEKPPVESTLISPFDPEPSDHPVLPDPPAVGHVGAPALHCLLLGLLRVPLDQVFTSCTDTFFHFISISLLPL